MDYERYLFLKALTRFNYFPNQKESIQELPPCIHTKTFTPEVALEIASRDLDKESKKLGFDYVEYHSTRHNNVHRTLGLIHPKPYSLLVKHLVDNYHHIEHISKSPNSMIKPEVHADGRIIIMNYQDHADKTESILSSSFGKKFIVEADIANCFNSIYTHSLSWAALGFDEYKKQFAGERKEAPSWHSMLDMYQRKTKRNETNGVPIGSATSSIFVELILSKVDSKLRDLGYEFKRYIDDYICYTESFEKANKFILDLTVELRVYKLSVNLNKTKIHELPMSTNDHWVTNLNNTFPCTEFQGESRPLTRNEVIHYINYAIEQNRSTPDGSVLKYALKKVIGMVDEHSSQIAFKFILNLSFHYPILIPLLSQLTERINMDLSEFSHQLNLLIRENAKHRRSDGISWPIYMMSNNCLDIEKQTALEIINSNDCVGISMLLHANSHIDEVLKFSKTIDESTKYHQECYWLLLYQLFKNGMHTPSKLNTTFDILKSYNVDFFQDPETYTEAESISMAKEVQYIFGDL
ncbi:antiviral reverse transcriptase Drt4 [Oceanimonas smirnovii]|uniref:antiviral reverse transcriptase Drt4 n=1 Tax=Oceanimonas smirnovii TaxID=264574 RepID=UPI003FD012E0